MRMIYFVLFFAILTFLSCQQRHTDNAVSTSGDVTTDVLSKVASPYEFHSHGSDLLVSKNGTFNLRFNARVQSFASNQNAEKLEQNGANCLIVFSGNIGFFRGGAHPSVALYTQARMSVKNATVVSDGTNDSHAAQICEAFRAAALKQETFTNSVVSYDDTAISFHELQFNVGKQNRQTMSDFLFSARPNLEDADNFDLSRRDSSELFFVKANEYVELTEFFLKDLNGKMIETLADVQDSRSPVELTIAKLNDQPTRPLIFNERDCNLSYTLHMSYVRAKSDGVEMQLMGGRDGDFNTSNQACVQLDETLAALNGEVKIKYSSKQNPADKENNKLTIYVTKKNKEKVVLKFKSI